MLDNIDPNWFVSAIFIIPFFGYVAYIYLYSFIRQMRESEEERDNPMTTCNVCNHPISKTARLCPNCGENFGNHSWVGESKVATIFMFLFSFSGFIFLIYDLLW